MQINPSEVTKSLKEQIKKAYKGGFKKIFELII